jgi:hypothetical protein
MHGALPRGPLRPLIRLRMAKQNMAEICNSLTSSRAGWRWRPFQPSGVLSVKSPLLSHDQITYAVHLHELLVDADERQVALVVPNTSTAVTDRNRLHSEMTAYSKRQATTRRNFQHACQRCTHWVEGRSKGPGPHSLTAHSRTVWQAKVADGVSLQRKQCRAEPGDLPSGTIVCHEDCHGRSKFCLAHKDLEKRCYVVGCLQPQAAGRVTCEVPEHRHMESRIQDKLQTTRSTVIAKLGRAKNLRRMLIDVAGAVGLSSRTTAQAQSGEVHEAMDGLDRDERLAEAARDGTPLTGREHGRSGPPLRLGYSMSHNEQLLVSCCGYIDARATMGKAESVTVFQVRASLMTRLSAESLPGILAGLRQVPKISRRAAHSLLRQHVLLDEASECRAPIGTQCLPYRNMLTFS